MAGIKSFSTPKGEEKSEASDLARIEELNKDDLLSKHLALSISVDESLSSAEPKKEKDGEERKEDE